MITAREALDISARDVESIEELLDQVDLLVQRRTAHRETFAIFFSAGPRSMELAEELKKLGYTVKSYPKEIFIDWSLPK